MWRGQWQNHRRAVGAALQAVGPYVRADKRRNGDAVAFCVADVGEEKRKRPFLGPPFSGLAPSGDTRRARVPAQNGAFLPFCAGGVVKTGRAA